MPPCAWPAPPSASCRRGSNPPRAATRDRPRARRGVYLFDQMQPEGLDEGGLADTPARRRSRCARPCRSAAGSSRSKLRPRRGDRPGSISTRVMARAMARRSPAMTRSASSFASLMPKPLAAQFPIPSPKIGGGLGRGLMQPQMSPARRQRMIQRSDAYWIHLTVQACDHHGCINPLPTLPQSWGRGKCLSHSAWTGVGTGAGAKASSGTSIASCWRRHMAA